MQWIIHYDIVAFALISVILIVYLSYNHLNTFPNRVYKRLLIVSLLSVVTDIASAFSCSFCTADQIILNYGVNILHFLVQNFVPCVYCLFAYSLVYENGQMNKKWFNIIFLPYILLTILILSTPFTDACFTIDDNGTYSRGWGQIFTYSIASYYVILSCGIVLKNIKVLGKAQRFAILIYSVECLVLTLIQLFLPKYLLQEIGIAFAMFFIYITVQNPLEFMDVQTGVYNRNLFKKTINGKIYKKDSYSIICIQVEGLSYINEKFGLHNGNVLLKQITNFLLTISKSNGVYRISNRRFAILLPDGLDYNYISQTIVDRFERPFSFDNINVNVHLWIYLCCL